MAGDQLVWRKSSYSGSQTDCVEVAPIPDATGVRDSKNVACGELRVSRTTWTAFVRAASARSGPLIR